MKAEVGKLKRAVCAAETVRFLFRAPRADRPAELVRVPPARVGKREFHGGSADFVRQESGELSPRESGDGQFRPTLERPARNIEFHCSARRLSGFARRAQRFVRSVFHAVRFYVKRLQRHGSGERIFIEKSPRRGLFSVTLRRQLGTGGVPVRTSPFVSRTAGGAGAQEIRVSAR